MTIKNVLGYAMVVLGLVVAAVGLHASSDAPNAPTHARKSAAASTLGTIAALGGGAALCFGGYRLLSANPAESARSREEDSGA